MPSKSLPVAGIHMPVEGAPTKVAVAGIRALDKGIGWEPTVGKPAAFLAGGNLVDGQVTGKFRSTYTLEWEGEEVSVPKSELFFPLRPDINDRYFYFSQLVHMTAVERKNKALLVTGESGVGKSFELTTILDGASLVEDDDYIFTKGFTSAAALYEQLEAQPDLLHIFDDCDSALKNPTSANIFKAILDIFARKRTVSWNVSGRRGGAGRRRFDFTGAVIFISNLNLHQFDQAVVSRCVTVDLQMTPEEKMTRMAHILNYIDLDISIEERNAILGIIDRRKHFIKSLNIRTLKKALLTYRETGDWGLVEYMISQT